MFFSEELQIMFAGTCPYNIYVGGNVPRNISQSMEGNTHDQFCFHDHMHRKGPLCGECEEITLSQLIPTTLAVSNVRATRMGGLSS